MRGNGPVFRDRVNGGEVLAGMFTQIPSEQVAEIAGLAGFDFLIIDLEHGSLTIDVAERLCRAAECVGIAPLMRAPAGRHDLVGKAVDVGAQGLLFPMIHTADDAAAAVAAATMGPQGRRGCCPECRSGSYFFDDFADYRRKTNDVVKIVQIETPQALANVEEIAKVPGVDGLLLGPGDLSFALEVGFDHPVIEDARKRVLEVANTNGLCCMHVLFNSAEVDAWAERGATVFSYSIDNIIYGQACRSIIGRIKERGGDRSSLAESR